MMKDLVASVDWAATALGPKAQWPQALLIALDMIMDARAPMVLFVGPEFLAIYNDAFAAAIVSKHPRAFARPARLGWPEEWPKLNVLLTQVTETGQAISDADQPAGTDISFSPLRDVDGSVCAVLGIAPECTERTKTNQEITRNAEQLRTLLAQAHVGIVVTDPMRRVLLVNAHFTEITGYSSGDLRGRGIDDLIISHSQPDDVEREDQLIGKDGRVIWASWSEGPIHDKEGRITQIGMIFSDVSARRAQEAERRRLAAIIASSDDAILSTDMDMRITSWNNGATRLYGYTAEEMIGKSVLSLVPADRQWEEQRILARISAGGRVQSHETVRAHKDGRLIDVSLTVSPLFNEDGQVIGASKIARDITDRRTAEKMQHVLVDEMKHRVKNILATVHAIARQTFSTLRTPETEAFEARLFALSRAQDMITRETKDGVDLSYVLREVLSPYNLGRFNLSGPAVELSPRAALSVTLGLHELATNAVKYGALSVAGGRVDISWSIEGEDPLTFTLKWQEKDGPLVTAPSRRGFGTSLISVVVPAELGGQAELDYVPSGLVWTVKASLGDWGRLPRPLPASSPADLLTDEI